MGKKVMGYRLARKIASFVLTRFLTSSVRGDRQVRCLRLCDAAADLHDALCEDRLATDNVQPSKRPETCNICGLHHRIRGSGHRDGRGGASLLEEGLVAFRKGDDRQWSLYIKLPDAALLCRVLHHVRAGAPVVLATMPSKSLWGLSWQMRSRAPY